MSEMLYKVNFIFSKELSYFIKTMVSNEYVRVRDYACTILNQHWEEWNAQFDVETHEIYKDEDHSEGQCGKAYLDFITKKMRGVLEQVNSKNLSSLVELDVDEEANVIGRCKFDRDITVAAYLIPIIEERA